MSTEDLLDVAVAAARASAASTRSRVWLSGLSP